jgi:diaminopimelate epimerase
MLGRADRKGSGMTKAIPFSKINGSGNDFLVVDDRGGAAAGIEDRPVFVAKVCDRARSIGADGVIFIGPSKRADFKWDFYNADGSRAEMCGNGGRCAARFAARKKIAGPLLSFETLAGVIRAEVRGRRVKLQMTKPRGLVERAVLSLHGKKIPYSFLDTGVPHAVVFVDDLEGVDIVKSGSGIRFHGAFAPKGTNANFAKAEGGVLRLRTYERGVEGETLACGTGAVAAGILAALRGMASSPVTVVPTGGERLTIHFDLGKKDFGRVCLEGDTSWVCDGKILEEAYRY